MFKITLFTALHVLVVSLPCVCNTFDLLSSPLYWFSFHLVPPTLFFFFFLNSIATSFNWLFDFSSFFLFLNLCGSLPNTLLPPQTSHVKNGILFFFLSSHTPFPVFLSVIILNIWNAFDKLRTRDNISSYCWPWGDCWSETGGSGLEAGMSFWVEWC